MSSSCRETGISDRVDKLEKKLDALADRLISRVEEIIDTVKQNKVKSEPEEEEVKTPEDAINWLLKEFDFERVHKMMVAADWTWRDNVLSPTVQELKEHVRQLYYSLVHGEEKSRLIISSGGFTLEKSDGYLDEGEEGDNCFTLTFGTSLDCFY